MEMIITVQIINLLFIVLYVTVIILVIRALLKYLRTKEASKEIVVERKSLSEVLKQHRMRCKMTQEFVAESIGVSRQAVSKWENGTSDPSTANLFSLAKLYGVRAEELLEDI